jgi:hypothetical protein
MKRIIFLVPADRWGVNLWHATVGLSNIEDQPYPAMFPGALLVHSHCHSGMSILHQTTYHISAKIKSNTF